jgi:hypothetical protein
VKSLTSWRDARAMNSAGLKYKRSLRAMRSSKNGHSGRATAGL